MNTSATDIILVQCPAWGVNMPPMSLAYISAYLRQHGFITEIKDLNIEEYHKTKHKEYWLNEKTHWWMEKNYFKKIYHLLNFDFNKIAEKLLEKNSSVFGFSVSASSHFYTFNLIKSIKSINSSVKIILGGRGVWLLKERNYFKDFVDFFVIQEGEETILELMKGIQKGLTSEELSKINGVCTKEYPNNFKSRLFSDLKKLPFPTYEELDLSNYTEKTIGVILSKGCIANCNFCEDKPYQGYYRTRNPEQVVEELNYHVKVNNINHFHFNDLAINGDYKKLEKMCDLIIKNKLDIRWIALAIARKDMPRDLLFKMKQAGCYTLNYGIESGSNSVLKRMNKINMFTVEEAEQTLKNTRDAGINVQPNFIIGYPGETEKEYQETLDFIKRNKGIITGITNINSCIIPKNSPLGQNPDKFGFIGNKVHEVEWEQTNLKLKDRQQRVKNTYKYAKNLDYKIWFSNFTQVQEKGYEKCKDLDMVIVLCPPWDIQMPPLGVAYLTTNLKKSGYSVEVIDMNIELYNLVSKNKKKTWQMEKYLDWELGDYHKKLFNEQSEYIDSVLVKIKEHNPLLVGLSVNAANYCFSNEFAKRLKKSMPNVKICIGGPISDNDFIWKKEIKKYLDLSIIGESELILPDVLSNLKKGEEISGISGVLDFKKKEKFIPAGPVTELNKLEHPTFEEFDLKSYKDKALPMISSRGCTARCNFCLDWTYRKKYSYRTAENVVDEIQYHINNNQIKKFTFRDLIINGNLKQLNNICDEILSRNLKINWSGQGIVNSKMNDDLLKKMKKSGFSTFVMGVESCSDTVLKAMNKPFRYEHLVDLLPRLHKAGIRTFINIIVGYPGEDEQEFQETYDFISKNSKYIYGISSLNPCCVIAPTELYTNPDKYNIVLPNTGDYYYTWYSKDRKNTYEIRKDRIKRLVSLCKQKRIKTPMVNLYDENASSDAFKGNHALNTEAKGNPVIFHNNREFDIILVNTPPWTIMFPPIGLAYIDSYLKASGVKTKIFDVNIDLYNSVPISQKKYWDILGFEWSNSDNFDMILRLFREKIDLQIEEIIKTNSDLIAVSSNRLSLKFTDYIINYIKEKTNKKIILGGYITNVPGELNKINLINVDYIIYGEGEQSLSELIHAYYTNADIAKIRSIGYIKGGMIKQTKTRKHEKDLSLFPYPDYSGFDMKKYSSYSISMILSRGCIGKCKFCDEPFLWKGYRFRVAEDIINEIEHHVKAGINNIFFDDLAVNGNPIELKKVCQMIIERDLKIEWGGNAIANRNLNEDLLSLMSAAGCYFLRFGIETGSDELLKKMRKPFRIAEAVTVLEHATKHNIQTIINLIVGLPGETKKDFNKTLEFVTKNKKNISIIGNIFTAYVKPQSEFELYPEKYGIILPDINHGYYWYDQSGNNHQIREERMKDLVVHCMDLGLELQNISANANNSFIFKEIENNFTVFLKNYRTIDPNRTEIKRNLAPDIILINPPPWGVDNPPTGIAYLSSYLENKGIIVEVFDFNIFIHNNVDDSLKYLWHFENKNFWKNKSTFEIIRKHIEPQIDYTVNRIIKSNSPIIGISVVDPKERITIELVKRIKALDSSKKIVLGGPACSTDDSRRIFVEEIPDLIDAFVINEGEETLYEMISNFQQGIPWDNIPGMLIFKKGEYTKYFPRLQKDYNSDFAFPTYKEFNLGDYTTLTLPLEWSRGCVANCAFCKIKGLWKGYHYRDPENIVQEIEYHVNVNKIKKFNVTDPTFNGDIKKLERVCDLLIEKNLNIKWFGQAIPSKAMTTDLLTKLKKSGMYKIEYGVESGSNKVLKNMRKPYTKEIIKECIKRTHEAGIPIFIFVIVGFPGETKKDFQMTMDFIKDLRPHIAAVKSVNTLHLIDDTDLVNRKEKYGIKIIDQSAWQIQWESDNGDNTYEVRKKRTERLLNFLKELNLPLIETNLHEGKEKKIVMLEGQGIENYNQKLDNLKKEIANIDGLMYHPDPQKMLSNVLYLIQCPPWSVDTPPVGINHLASYLKLNNINVEVIDFNLKLYKNNKNLQKVWSTNNKKHWTEPVLHNELIKNFSDEVQNLVTKIGNAKYIGFSAYQDNILTIIHLCNLIKKENSECILIVGGPSCYVEREKRILLNSAIDFLVVGDGEESLINLINSLDNKKEAEEISQIPGILVKGYEKNYTPSEAFNLNKAAPFMEINSYSYVSNEKRMSLYFSRGCIGKCVFCNDVNIMGKFRTRPAQIVFDEIKFHYNQGYEHFAFNDLVINGNIKELTILCDLIIESKMEIDWIANAIPMINLTPKVLSKLKQAGCNTLMFGVESGSDKVLKDMNKYTNVATIEKVLKESKDQKIKNWINFIVGFPTETEQDFRLTLDFLERNINFIDRICVANTCNILYKSDLMEKKDKYGIILPDDEKVTEFLWYTKEGNNWKLRKSRLEILLNKIKQFGLEVHQNNLSDFDLLDNQNNKEFGIQEIPNSPKKLGLFEKIMQGFRLIDEVNLGNRKSELIHEALATWRDKTPHSTSCYRGPDNYAAISFNPFSKNYNKSYWRDFASEAGVALKSDADCDLVLKIKVYDNSYNQGPGGRPTIVKISYDNKEWFEIGKFKIHGKEKWIIFTFKINSQLVRGDKLFILMDDNENYELNKYGKTIAWIRLYKDGKRLLSYKNIRGHI